MVRPIWYLATFLAVLLLVPPSLYVEGASGLEGPNRAVAGTGPTGPWDQTEWTRYRDLDDTENELKVLASEFPSICTLINLSAMLTYPGGAPRYSIEGRTIWGLKISDNPKVNESGEPEVFYCALTHAREWISNEVLMYFINYVLRNYANNSTISYLVNTTQLWFVPIVNPDGFQESIDQDDFNNSYGYYGWRKNVNETNGSPGFQNYGSAQGDGTDLNRNFGYKWGYPGSSTDPGNPTYRGSTAFSEPETQLIRELFMDREFSMALSLHSFSGLNLYPWGYTTDQAVDSPLLSRIAQKMSDINGYTAIPSSSLYYTSGDFVDFVYGTFRIPAYTVEINHRNSRFIPELSKVPEDCHLNREVCMLMADLSHDPYYVFGSGINGTVKDVLGRTVGHVRVNLRGMNRDLNLTTSSEGTFSVSLEPGTYTVTTEKGPLHNVTTTVVQSGRYAVPLYLMSESVPPEAFSVNMTVDGDEVRYVEWGEKVTFSVTERYNESNLTGTIEIFDPGWTGPMAVTYLVQNASVLEAIWDTRSYEPQMTYGIEVKLMDEYGNWDLDGTNSSGFDIMIAVNDTTPPDIYDIDLEGDRNDDGSFEKGEAIEIVTNVTGGSSWETDINITATIIGPNGSVHSAFLEWQPVTDRYHSTVPTDGLPLGNYTCYVSASDRFGNRMDAPPVAFSLDDTTGPGFVLYLGNYQTGAYRSGTPMEFIIRPLVMEPGLNASVTVEGPDIGVTLTDATMDIANGTFSIDWDSWNVPSGLYHAEGRLSDALGNFLPDGSQTGHDLSFNMLDLTPPEVFGLVVNGYDITVPTTMNSTNNASIEVLPLSAEQGMSCSIGYTFTGSGSRGLIDISWDQDRFFGVLDAFSMEGLGQYYLEVHLSDRFGNMDPDGRFLDHDLVLNLKRPDPEIVRTRAFNKDHGEEWGTTGIEWVLEGETIELSCNVRNLTVKDRTDLRFNGQWRAVESLYNATDATWSALFLWNTTGRVGDFNITWEVVPDGAPQVSSTTYIAKVVPRERDHVRDAKVKGFYRYVEDGFVVNLTWTPPSGAHLIKVEMRSNTTFQELELSGSANNGSFTVPWEDIVFTFTAVHRLFPEGSDRWAETAESTNLELGVSRAVFLAPDKDLPPEDDDTEDDDDEGPLEKALPLALVIAFVLILAMVALLLFLGRGRRTLPPEVWEE